MKIKTNIFYISFLIITFFSFNAQASINPFLRVDHLTEAILETHSALNAADVKAIIQHAEKAKNHAVATKNDVSQQVDHQLLDNGIESLIIVVVEGNSGNIELAREAAYAALVYITQSAR